VFKLSVAVGMIGAFSRLAIALKRVSQRTQHLGDFGASNLEALRNKFSLQVSHTLAGPPQGRLRIAAFGGLHETINRINQVVLNSLKRFSAATGSPLAMTGQRAIALQFFDAIAYGAIGQTRGQRNRSNATVAKCHRFGSSPAPSPPLIEIPHERIKLQFQSIDKMCVVH
jgi:hypothetical protein